MALPGGNDVEFKHVKKTTGRVTLQLIVKNKYVFRENKKATSVGTKSYFKCSKVSFFIKKNVEKQLMTQYISIYLTTAFMPIFLF